jgi:hypothetical protein
MNSLRVTLAFSIAAALASGALAQSPEGRTRVIRVGSTQPASTQAAQAPAAAYSTEVPLVQRSAPADGGQGTTLVLNAAHSFNVTLSARDPRPPNGTGPGIALPQTDVFGYFAIPALTQNPSNPEVFIKVLDATAIPGQGYWIFYGFLTDLIFDLTVHENATGRQVVFHKDAGQALNGFDTTTFTPAAVTTRETEAIAATPNAFVRTAVDITNHTQASITADVQYSYTCPVACSPPVAFNSSLVTRFTLGPFGNLHFDDVVQALADQGALTNPGVVQGSYGTLLVTFNGLPGNVGWEATAQARTYNRLSEPDPLRGTVGYGMNGSLFFESSRTSVTGTVRDTHVTPGLEGSLVSQVGIRNTDITGTNGKVNVDVSLYDPDTAGRVGSVIPLNNISPGEVRLISDVFTAAGVAGLNKTLIVFADVRSPGTNTPTIEGFVLFQDKNSGDIRFTEMRCANVGGC